MGDIYQNAYLVLAAASGRDATESLFPSEAKRVHQYEWTVDGTSYTICVAKDINHGSFSGTKRLSLHPRPHQPLPLLSRAWCLQEQLLSFSTIILTSDEVIWECNEGLSCECGGMQRKNVEWAVDSLKTRLTAAGLDEKELLDVWYAILRDYTGRGISFPSDRLPALSGLVSRLSIALGEYHAGHWMKDLLESLLWHSEDGPGKRSTIPGLSQPPSWSWHSVDGRIRHLHKEVPDGPEQGWTSEVVDLVNVKSTPTTSDAFGMVLAASLALDVWTFLLKVDLLNPASEHPEWARPGEIIFHKNATLLSPPKDSRYTWEQAETIVTFYQDIRYSSEDTTLMSHNIIVFVGLFARGSSNQDYMPFNNWRGLFILPRNPDIDWRSSNSLEFEGTRMATGEISSDFATVDHAVRRRVTIV